MPSWTSHIILLSSIVYESPWHLGKVKNKNMAVETRKFPVLLYFDGVSFQNFTKTPLLTSPAVDCPRFEQF